MIEGSNARFGTAWHDQICMGLITGAYADVLEVAFPRAAGGEIVLDFHVGGPGRMFRIYKYAPDYPGIAALGLGGSP